MSNKSEFWNWVKTKRLSKADERALKQAYSRIHKERALYNIDNLQKLINLNDDGRLDLYCEFMAAKLEEEIPGNQEEPKDEIDSEMRESNNQPIEDNMGKESVAESDIASEEVDENSSEENNALQESEQSFCGTDELLNHFEWLAEKREELLTALDYQPLARLSRPQISRAVFDITTSRFMNVSGDGIYPMEKYIEYEDKNEKDGRKIVCHRNNKTFAYTSDLQNMFSTAVGLNGEDKNDIIKRSIDDTWNNYKITGTKKSICLIPDTVGDFNDGVKKQLRQYSSRILQIPRSIAAAYAYVEKFGKECELTVYDLNLSVPCETQISIQKREKDGWEFIRVKRKKRNDLGNCSLKAMLKNYLWEYGKNNEIEIPDNTIKALIDTCDILGTLWGNGNILIATEQTYCTIKGDNELYKAVLGNLVNLYDGLINSFDKREFCILIDLPLNDNIIFSFDKLRTACNKIFERIDANKVIWKEYLPELSLEVIKDGRYKKLQLIKEEERIQEITQNSMDERIVLEVKDGIFCLPAREKVISLPLEREEFGNMKRDKWAEFTGKEFPLAQNIDVILKISYTFGDPDSYRLTAVGKDDPDFIITSQWLDDDENKEVKLGGTSKITVPEYDGNEQIFVDSPEIDKMRRALDRVDRRIQSILSGRFVLEISDGEYRESNIFMNVNGSGLIYNVNLLKKISEKENYSSGIKKIFDDFMGKASFYELTEYLVATKDSNLYKEMVADEKLKSALDISVLNFMSLFGAMYCETDDLYYGDLIKMLLDRFTAEAEKGRIEAMIGASRCISSNKEYISQLAKVVLKLLASNNESVREKVIRNISAVCWYNSEWMFNFIHAEPKIIKRLEYSIKEYFRPGTNGNKMSKAESEIIGKTLKVRDIMEVALALCRLRVEDETIFDPDDREVKAIVNVLKNIDQIVHEKEYSLKKPFVSRVKFDESIKGALYNVSDPCFLLISQLTGRTGIKLLGYKED